MGESWLRFSVRKRTEPTRYARLEILVKFQTKGAMRVEQFIRGCNDTNVTRRRLKSREKMIREREGRVSKPSPPGTSDRLWQFKSCERGEGIATLESLSRGGESLGIISAKF